MSYKIDYASFFQKGLKYNPLEDYYYSCIVAGFQGSGKTYFSVKLSKEQTLFKKIVTNIQTLNINDKIIDKITKLEEIYSYEQEENILYLLDEIHKKFPKNAKIDERFYSFLQQMRKKKSCMIMITQEWRQVPPWLRLPVRYIYSTYKLPFSKIFYTDILDAQKVTWSNEQNEWIAPTIQTHVYKRTKKIGDMYDTNEIILDL